QHECGNLVATAMKHSRHPPGQRNGRWVLVAITLVGATGASWLTYRAVEQYHMRQLSVQVPDLPDLTGKPIALQLRLETALRRARNPDTYLLGVEELGRLYHANGFADEAAWCWRQLAVAQPKNA